MTKPFLYQLFDTTRTQLRLPLGLEEYDALLQLVQEGNILYNIDELRFACEVLWIKKTVHLTAFRTLFDQQNKEELQIVLQLLAKQAKEQEEQKGEAVSSESAEVDPSSESTKPPANDLTTESTEDQTQQQSQQQSQQTTKPQTDDAEVLLSLEESEEGVALREDQQQYQSILSHPYILSDAYHPINRRDMRQSWRRLRQQTPAYFTTTIDIERTITDFAKEGFLGKVHYQQQYEDKVKLLLLIDYKGSMVAFHALANQLIHTALSDHKRGHTQTYFFHDVPKEHLFLNPARTKAVRKEKLWQKLSTKHTRVLIFSDAGAARGQIELARIDDTWDFLDELRPQVRQIAWLNPVPRSRWADSTAAEIAEITPMFETSQSGFRAAVRHLRGKSA